MKSLWSPSPESSTVHLLKTSLSWKQVGRRPREGPGEIYPAYLQNQTVMYCCFRQQRQNKSCFISICPGQPNEFPNWVSKPVVRCDWNDFQGQRDPQGLVRMIFMVRSSIFPVLRLKNVLCMDLSGALKEHLYSLSREKHDLNPNMACCCLLCSSVQLKIIVWQASQLGLPDDIYRCSGWTQLPPNTLQPSNETSSCPTLRINHSSVDSWATVPALLCLPAWSKSYDLVICLSFSYFSDVRSIWIVWFISWLSFQNKIWRVKSEHLWH